MHDTGKALKTSILVLISGFGIAYFNTPVAADIGELCSGSTGLLDGQWARYATDAPLMKERVESRHAIVGMEAGHYWMEFEAVTPMGSGAVIMKILIPGWPYAVGSVKRALMQLPRVEGMDSMPPMEMPPSAVQKDNLSDPIRMACEELDKGFPEQVTVAAGTFNAMRIPVRQLGKDVWLSSSVPFGIVKMADTDNKGTELMAFGSDAQSAIIESPQRLPGMEQQ